MVKLTIDDLLDVAELLIKAAKLGRDIQKRKEKPSVPAQAA